MDTEELREKMTKEIASHLEPGMLYEHLKAYMDSYVATLIAPAFKVTCDETTNTPESVAAGYLSAKMTPKTLAGVMMAAEALKLTELDLIRAGKFYLRFLGTSVFIPLVRIPSKRHMIGPLRIVKRIDKQRQLFVIKL